MKASLPASPMLSLLVSLVLLAEASGFVPSVSAGGARRSLACGPPVSRDDGRRPVAATATSLGKDCDAGTPAVVVSFGLTPSERLAAEQAVRAGAMFPAGLHVVDGAASAATADGSTLREAIMRSSGPSGEHPLPQALVDAMTDTHTTTPTNTANKKPSSGAGVPGDFMPNLWLVLQSPTNLPPAEAEGLPDWLALSMMEALDACESVPPAIVSCVPPPPPPPAPASSSSSSPSPSVLSFDAALLDMPLADLWRREARRHFIENGLSEPLKVHETEWSPSSRGVNVAMNLELDGSWVPSSNAPGAERWDTSKLVVLDGLVDEDLCRELLDLVTEPGWATKPPPGPAIPGTTAAALSLDEPTSGNEETPVRERPPPSKWERGLTDVDEEEEEEEGGGGGRGAGPGSWGLTEEAMEWLCRDGEHPAIVELQSRLCKLYPDFEISHMPEAVMGPSTARMVANAPVYGDRFSWHVDADPAAFPPSPWRDHFGTYTNREPGMPLFATLLIYLDADWRREWDAETLFLDPPTGTGVFVRPRAGRAIVMDQDVTHRISTPSQTANRPRYSLVLKLIFFSKQHGRYDNRSSSSPFPGITQTTSGTTPGSAAAPHGAPGVSHAPPEPCISSLSALRPKNENSQRGARVRFGSSSESSSERARPSGRSSSPDSTPPAAAPVPPPPFQGDATAAAAGGLEPLDAESPLVEVRPVGAKGKGLFSTRPIAKGVPVAFYSGEVLTAEQLDDRYPGFEGSDYVMQLGPDRYLDARDPEKSSIARYANHSGRPNLVVELRPVDGNSAAGVAATASSGFPDGEGVALTTLRDVVGGEELTFDYGEEFFDGDDDEGSVIEDGLDMQQFLGGIDWGSNTLSM